ncbi:unnamed protein product [Meganyctiphanes norvegica]|uniref:Apextrin C-terminal domain-containing protein n=1 Tax=Meganyctiphanes norvegica TaxID=48144 RepID=A0AAV2QFK8_MEGNR
MMLLLLLNIFALSHCSTIPGISNKTQAPDGAVPSYVSDWPVGYYGLPKPTSGCPGGGWEEGWRYHDTEDHDDEDSWSDPIHLAGSLSHDGMRQEFCMKPNDEGEEWPAGDYCIYKSGDHCPTHFNDGAIYIDDEDHNNENNYGGIVPSGSYEKNTFYQYCCRIDGDPENGIHLPTTKEFFLFPHSPGCQKVVGMNSSMEYLHFDTEDHNDASYVSGVHPKADIGSGSAKNPTIYYCYYTPTL